MATEVSSTVDPGDVGADYADLAAWVADNYGTTGTDLVSQDEFVTAVCSNTSAVVDATRATYAGTTDATRFIHVKASDLTSKYLCDPSTSGHFATINTGFITFEGLDITGLAGTSSEAFRVTAGPVVIRESVIHDLTTNQQDVLYTTTDDILIRMINVAAFNINRVLMHFETPIASPQFYGCYISAHDINTGAHSRNAMGWNGSPTGSPVFKVRNIAIHKGGGSQDNFETINVTEDEDYCISSDASTSGSNSTNSATFADTTGASAVIFVDLDGDLDLQDHANNIALADGVNISSDADFLNVNIDHLGNTRDASTPDIGWHELQVAGDTEVNATTDALVITEQGAAVSLDIDIAATTDPLILTEQAAAISLDVDIQATSDALVIAEQAATVNAATNVNATAQALTITPLAATIQVSGDVNVNAGMDALVITGQAATVNAATNVSATTAALTLTTFQATVDFTTGTNVLANTAALNLVAAPATVNASTIVQASTASLALSALPATVSASGDVLVNAGVATLALASFPATVKVTDTTALLRQVKKDFQAFFYKDLITGIPTEFAIPWSTATASGIGIFDEEGIEGPDRIVPRLWVESTTIDGLVQRGDLLTVNGLTRRVYGLQPDGQGVTQVVLEFVT